MREVYLLNVTAHVLAALLWLGGMFFLAVVGAPVLRRVEPAQLRSELFRRLGESFRTAGWIAIAILVVTGVLNLHFAGVLRNWSEPSFWTTPYARALAWKLGAVTVMLTVQGAHDFVIGPRATMVQAGSREAQRLRVRAAWMARINALVGLVLVVAAVRLARGG